MSRCLPFPSPNYVKNNIGGESLLQQLELGTKRGEYSEKKRCHDDDDKKNTTIHEEKDRRRKRKGRKHDISESENKTDPSMEELEKRIETNLEYTKLIVNWVPLPLQMVPNDFEEEEEEWFSRKNVSNSESDTTDSTKHVGSSSTAGIYQGIQPIAYYLPYADIYVLPYTVPF